MRLFCIYKGRLGRSQHRGFKGFGHVIQLWNNWLSIEIIRSFKGKLNLMLPSGHGVGLFGPVLSSHNGPYGTWRLSMIN